MSKHKLDNYSNYSHFCHEPLGISQGITQIEFMFICRLAALYQYIYNKDPKSNPSSYSQYVLFHIYNQKEARSNTFAVFYLRAKGVGVGATTGSVGAAGGGTPGTAGGVKTGAEGGVGTTGRGVGVARSSVSINSSTE